MDPSQVVKSAVVDAARLAAMAGDEARVAKSRAIVRVRRLEGERDAIRDEKADARVWRGIVASVLWVPFVRARALARYDARIGDLDGRACAAEEAVLDVRRRVESCVSAAAQASRISANLGRAGRAIGELGAPPPDVVVAAATVSGRVRFLAESRRGPGWLADALRTSRSAVDAVRDWAKAKSDRAESDRVEQTRREVARVVAPQQRIYLPVPAGSARLAARMGALLDDSARSGESRAFVTMDMNLAPFREMLPLAYRPTPTRFEYPPVPFRHAGQNLWGVFDRPTWDHVRQSSYDMTGRRCAVCGRRGGWLAEKLFGPEERRRGVECHEIWEWSMPDVSSGIGIQRLKRLLVVCPDCHMMFHEGFARHKARDMGIEQEAADYIRKRRMLVGKMTGDALDRGLEKSREALKRMTGADRWVMDLTALGNQQFMTDRIPLLREANDAQFSPECVAGLAFETDSGRVFPARAAADIYRGLLENDPGADWNVVALPRR